jgi:CDP-glucose 4,6-dehydratase
VLITGHTGFKGSWLSLWLSYLGAKVSGYSLPPPSQPSNFQLSRVEEILVNHYVGDIRDGAKLTTAIKLVQPQVIFHLAAQPLVHQSYNKPAETFEVNVLGTARLLDAVRSLEKPCAVLVITSDKCYENREQVWGYREIDPMGGHDPYSASKGATELLVSSYRSSFFSPTLLSQHGTMLASVRAGNVIGGGDWAANRVVPDMVKHLSINEPVPIRNPNAVRPWQHVLEPLSGYIQLADRMLNDPQAKWCSGWNFGPRSGDEVPVRDLVDQFCKQWGRGSWKDVSNPGQLHEAGILRLSIEKAWWELGWKPRWTLEETVCRTARWYRQVLMGQCDPRSECFADIEAYQTHRISCP